MLGKKEQQRTRCGAKHDGGTPFTSTMLRHGVARQDLLDDRGLVFSRFCYFIPRVAAAAAKRVMHSRGVGAWNEGVLAGKKEHETGQAFSC